MNTRRAGSDGGRLLRNSQLAGLCLALLLTAPFTDCNRAPSGNPAVQAKSTIRITTEPGGPVMIRTSTAEFRLAANGYLQAKLLYHGQELTLDDPQADSNSSTDYVVSSGKEIQDFALDLDHARIIDASGRLGGSGKRIEISGKSQSVPGLEKTVALEVYDRFPNLLLSSTSYKNTGTSDVALNRVVTQQHILNASLSDPQVAPYAMWSFHGSSEAWGKDDVMFITDKFSRPNPMQVVLRNDENQTGGGIPVVAFWTKSVGEAIGHAEAVPTRLSLPVHTRADGRVDAAVVVDADSRLQPGQVYATPLTFVSVFYGDFFEPLSLYSKMLQGSGLSLAHPTKADYEANWCGWGYEMDFTPKQMLGTIPKLKELGLRWATLDAGWFASRGDWEPRNETFPDDSLQKVVKAYHDAGIHITLWWIPLVAEDGHGKDILNHRPYRLSNVVRDHPDWLVLDKEASQPAPPPTSVPYVLQFPRCSSITRSSPNDSSAIGTLTVTSSTSLTPYPPATTPSTITSRRMTRSAPWLMFTRSFWKPRAR